MIEALTNSEMGVYLSCRQKWFLSHLLRLQPPTYDDSRVTGTIWHQMMDQYWSTRDPQATINWFLSGHSKLANTHSSKFQFLSLILWGYHNHYQSHDRNMRLVATEKTLSGKVPVPGTPRNHWHDVQGKIDKQLHDEQLHFDLIMDHKGTTHPVERWAEMNKHNSQASVYMWLAAQATGFTPRRLVYDVVLWELPPNWTQFRVVKDGTRLHKTLPSGATAQGLMQAILGNGFRIDDEIWYREKMNELMQRPPKQYFLRVPVEPPEFELSRIETELFVVASETARAQKIWSDRWQSFLLQSKTHEWREAIMPLLQKGITFPRNQYFCKSYGRQCDYHDVCWYREPQTLDSFTLRESYHPENEEE